MTSEEFRNNPMFLRNQFDGDGIFQMPLIKKDTIDIKNISFVGYDKLSEKEYDKIVHFFLDDYKFEVMWNNPEPRIDKLSKYKVVLTPQFSLFTEMPIGLKIYQTFKNRWCGAYFQSKGIKTIPSLAWGDSDTYWFCFDGIEKRSVVAVSTIGVKTEKDLFLAGYNEMLRKLQPSAIICYGNPFEEMKGNITIIDYAETNNLKSKGIYVHKTYRYFDFDKGMGSAGNKWKPKDDNGKLFVGDPNTKNTKISKKGEKYEYKIGDDGKATVVRHHSDHGSSKYHSNPHDHKVNWDTPDGHPELGREINYPDGNIPDL